MIHAVSEQRGVHRIMEQLFGKEVLHHVAFQVLRFISGPF